MCLFREKFKGGNGEEEGGGGAWIGGVGEGDADGGAGDGAVEGGERGAGDAGRGIYGAAGGGEDAVELAAELGVHLGGIVPEVAGEGGEGIFDAVVRGVGVPEAAWTQQVEGDEARIAEVVEAIFLDERIPAVAGLHGADGVGPIGEILRVVPFEIRADQRPVDSDAEAVGVCVAADKCNGVA